MADQWKPGKKFVDPTRLSRKVFDKHVDRMELKRKRDREDHRADVAALLRRIQNLEDQLIQLFPIEQGEEVDLYPKDYVQMKDGRWRKRSTEGL